MIVLSALLVAVAIVFCFALAASSSPVYGFNAKAELASRRDSKELRGQSGAAVSTPMPLTPSFRPGVSKEDLPVLSAAGMQ